MRMTIGGVHHEIGLRPRRWPTALVLMSEGRIVEEAPPSHLFHPTPKHERSRQFPAQDSLTALPEQLLVHNGYTASDTGPQAQPGSGFRGDSLLCTFIQPHPQRPSFSVMKKVESDIGPAKD